MRDDAKSSAGSARISTKYQTQTSVPSIKLSSRNRVRTDSAANWSVKSYVLQYFSDRLRRLLQVILLSIDVIKHEPANSSEGKSQPRGKIRYRRNCSSVFSRSRTHERCSTRVWQAFSYGLGIEAGNRSCDFCYRHTGFWIFFQPGVNGFEGRSGDASRCYRSVFD